MGVFVALLRAVNVGGTGKLPMRDLVALCEEAGFTSVRTYIASGNAVFAGDGTAAQVKAVLEARLKAYAEKPIGILVRTGAELFAVLAENPFPVARCPSRPDCRDLPRRSAAGGLFSGRHRPERRGDRAGPARD